MRLSLSLIACAFLLCVSNIAAHADTITTFTLTHGSDTIQFSLSDSTPFTLQTTDNGTVDTFEYNVPLTVNGTNHFPGVAGDLASEGVETLQPLGVGAEFYVAYQTGEVDGSPTYLYLFEQGSQVFTEVNGQAVFTPETIVFPQVYVLNYTSPQSASTLEFDADTLVITEANVSDVPEPSTFILLGTGLVGALGAVRRRFAC